ncbi:hypothetical protein EYC84_004859 [Monilinia fructicola]|uniref:Uncharacterized protein n=1 Tax=Monilinia fructicola TaxID=38448 RepID=A0A5M9KA28_MONFR|nr:hypothetical protein EYC84_004859 [Monilinia fructicola]
MFRLIKYEWILYEVLSDTGDMEEEVNKYKDVYEGNIGRKEGVRAMKLEHQYIPAEGHGIPPTKKNDRSQGLEKS